jgi:hypothetical protein
VLVITLAAFVAEGGGRGVLIGAMDGNVSKTQRGIARTRCRAASGRGVK